MVGGDGTPTFMAFDCVLRNVPGGHRISMSQGQEDAKESRKERSWRNKNSQAQVNVRDNQFQDRKATDAPLFESGDWPTR